MVGEEVDTDDTITLNVTSTLLHRSLSSYPHLRTSPREVVINLAGLRHDSEDRMSPQQMRCPALLLPSATLAHARANCSRIERVSLLGFSRPREGDQVCQILEAHRPRIQSLAISGVLDIAFSTEGVTVLSSMSALQHLHIEGYDTAFKGSYSSFQLESLTYSIYGNNDLDHFLQTFRSLTINSVHSLTSLTLSCFDFNGRIVSPFTNLERLSLLLYYHNSAEVRNLREVSVREFELRCLSDRSTQLGALLKALPTTMESFSLNCISPSHIEKLLSHQCELYPKLGIIELVSRSTLYFEPPWALWTPFSTLPIARKCHKLGVHLEFDGHR